MKAKKLISVILAVVLLVCFPITAFSKTTEQCEAKLLQAGDFDINYNRDYSDMHKNIFGVTTYDVNMSDIEKKLEERIYQGLSEGWSAINFYLNEGLSREWAMTMYSDVINDHPELFYVSHNYGIEYTFSTVTKIVPHYTMSMSEIDSAKKVFNDGVNKALALCDNSMDAMQKALVIHDYICSNATYAEDGDIAHSAWGFFKNGRIVCAGYALTYSYLMNKLGVECEMVTSIAMNHGWNTIKINGKWYGVDCTWDDAGSSSYGHMPDNRVNHGCFLKSQAHMNRNGWDTFDDCDCTDKSMDSGMFWEDVHTTIQVKNGKYYYLDPDYKVKMAYLRERTQSGSERLFGKGFKCEGNDSGGSTPTLLYCQLAFMDGKFFVSNKQEINSVDLKTARVSLITNISTTKPNGLGVNGMNIMYQVNGNENTFITVNKNDFFKSTITRNKYQTYNAYCDLNCDGAVNAKDYILLKEQNKLYK